MWNPSRGDCKCSEQYKFDEYLDVKNCYCEKLSIGKSVLKFEDKKVNII